MPKKQRADIYDIAIIGGGPAGLALAAGLAPHVGSIALIERSTIASQISTAFDGRTTALAHQGVTLLQRIGAWRELSKHAEPITHIRVADQFSSLKLDFRVEELNLGPFGMMVEQRHLRQSLWTRVQAAKNVTVFEGDAVDALDVSGYQAALSVGGKKIQANLAIGADGRTSPSRQQLGISGFGLTYNQHALICTVEHSLPHNNVALEHFLPEGPFATLPLTSVKGGGERSARGRRPDSAQSQLPAIYRSGIVWTAKPDTVQALLALDESDFITALAENGAGFLGTLKLHTPRAMYPLALQHAASYTAPHFVLVGDAAHAMHPIAGQGFNMGLRDIACLIDLIIEAQNLGLRVDDSHVLTRYEQQRRGDNQRMLIATDLLDRLFSNRSQSLALARQIGISLVDRIGPLRRFFMTQAMGLTS